MTITSGVLRIQYLAASENCSPQPGNYYNNKNKPAERGWCHQELSLLLAISGGCPITRRGIKQEGNNRFGE